MTTAPGRLIDCVVVNDEVDLLRSRMRYLAPYVDAFVVVEARVDHRGRPKPAYIDESGILESATRETVHVALESLWSNSGTAQAAAREREMCQRNAIVGALARFAPTDVAIVCDVDEFPSPEALQHLRNGIHSTTRLEMIHSVMYANLRTRHLWEFAYASQVGPLTDPHWTRFHPQVSDERIPNGGWHLSYLGGSRNVSNKFSTTSHSELDRGYLKSDRHLQVCRALGCHPATTFKLLDWFPPTDLPTQLLEGYVRENTLPRRSLGKKALAAAYSCAVSPFVDENWRIRVARDRMRDLRRRIPARLHGRRSIPGEQPK
jgi:beta-1,4-mannosyl-glycoprotein beta-1,4-N-acetylglucosaminyltransferase